MPPRAKLATTRRVASCSRCVPSDSHPSGMAPQPRRPRAASASLTPPKRQKKSMVGTTSDVDDGAANPPPKAPADAKPAEASPSPKRPRLSVVASADAKPAEASPRSAVGDGQLPPAPVPGPDSATMWSLRRPRLVGEDRPPPLQGHVPGSSSGSHGRAMGHCGSLRVSSTVAIWASRVGTRPTKSTIL